MKKVAGYTLIALLVLILLGYNTLKFGIANTLFSLGGALTTVAVIAFASWLITHPD